MKSNPTEFEPIDQLCINTVRTLSIDAIQKANSGHPGLPLGAAPMAYVLWQRHLKHSPTHPKWQDRDRFVLSAGHGSMLLYSLLHLYGYDLPLEEIKNFRQWGSKTPGHPEHGLTSGVEATTGPLGQGTAVAVGMAIAERFLANLFNRPDFEMVNHYTYALVSDGDLMEGIASEASSLAGHLKLGKLIYLYDSNDVTLDGPTSMAFTAENVAKRYEAYGWKVLHVEEGNEDLSAIDRAIVQAKSHSTAPTLIIVKTTIGFGSPNKQGTSAAHGSPLGPDEVKLTKKTLHWPEDKSFWIPEDTRGHFKRSAQKGEQAEAQWLKTFTLYRQKHPDLARLWDQCFSGQLPTGWEQSLLPFEAGKAQPTRKASGTVLNVLCQQIPWILGGDADLSCSTNTTIQGTGSFEGQTGSGRNIHYGVREHAMAGIANGISYHEGVRPFVSTFFCFSDYMKPSIRLAALDHLPNIYVFTHDSIALGEDGPTHQPVEHLAALRALPHLTLIRPSDANETIEAWKVALKNTSGPTALVLTRQDLPVFDRSSRLAPASGLAQGAYILSEAAQTPQAILIATGSEVALALQAQTLLEKERIFVRVVAMPSWELFETQEKSYQEKVLPASIPFRLAIETGSPLGWERWVGNRGRILGVNRFGASAPHTTTLEKYGFSPQNVAQLTREMLNH